MPIGERARRAPTSFARQMLLPATLLFLAGWLWSLASPLGSGPDEKDHAIRSWTAIHGDLVGSETELGGGSAGYTVPAWLLNLAPDCYAQKSAVPASCAPLLGEDDTPTDTLSRAGLSPPMYHLVTGLPFLVVDGRVGVFGARLVSTALAAVLVAAALVLARDHRARSLLVPSVLLAWTPTSLFLSGVLNPSGLEIAAAILIWVAGLTLLDDDSSFSLPLRLALFAVASAAFILDRQLSPVLYGVIGLALLALASRARVAELLATRAARIALLGIGVAGVLAVAWLLAYRPLEAANDDLVPPDGSNTEVAAFAFGRQALLLLQMIGWFGWLDLRGPSPVAYLWIAASVGVVALAAGQLGRRDRAVIGLVLVVAIALPTTIEAVNLRTHGIVWQGRYTLPIAMGVVLVAAGRAQFDGTAAALVAGVGRAICVLAPAGAWVSYGAMLRRNSVGTDERFWNVVTDPVWDPPTKTWFLLAASFACSVGMSWYARQASVLRPDAASAMSS